MNYLQFDFHSTNSSQSEQLIALLSNQNFEGFEEDDDSLKAFIPENLFNENEFAEIVKIFPSILYTRVSVENINWNQQWESGFSPVTVGDFVAIRAGFHQPITNVAHEIIITPKMSFGTGHHATTHMMVQQMQHIDFANKSVLDFGTGTGVLAILAEKLGASKVFAIDNDEWSITNTIENIEQNSCSKITVELHNEIPKGTVYDVILANINLNVILANLDSIATVAKTGTPVLLSGFLLENEDRIKSSTAEAGFTYLSTVKKGDWIAVLIEKQ
ncbi:50S ribosomal protein L11 methyltransferase [Ferruginibacter sp. SUN002]|uniref:50S ribosomal protein L11 methyltransferase n=1 Tax=Ferruginibacter sp. SUN002 TaxID=2937789 RepID=UPI003D359EEF